MATTRKQSTSIRVYPETHAALGELAKHAGLPLTQYVARLTEAEQRRHFWERMNAAGARVKQDPAAWASYREESRELEGTLSDGLDGDAEEWNDGPADAATW